MRRMYVSWHDFPCCGKAGEGVERKGAFGIGEVVFFVLVYHNFKEALLFVL